MDNIDALCELQVARCKIRASIYRAHSQKMDNESTLRFYKNLISRYEVTLNYVERHLVKTIEKGVHDEGYEEENQKETCEEVSSERLSVSHLC